MFNFILLNEMCCNEYTVTVSDLSRFSDSLSEKSALAVHLPVFGTSKGRPLERGGGGSWGHPYHPIKKTSENTL